MVGGGRVDPASLLPIVAAYRDMGASLVKITPSSLLVAFDRHVAIPADDPIGIAEDEPASDDEIYGSAD